MTEMAFVEGVIKFNFDNLKTQPGSDELNQTITEHIN